jgi:hypothetical protein
LPLGAAASALIIIGLREEPLQKHQPKLDWLGTAMLLAALLLLFYALSPGAQPGHGIAEPWALLVLAAAALTFFVVVERRATEPIIPTDLFHLKLFNVSAAIAALASMGVFGAISYLPLYLQGVYGLAASRAGLVLLLLSVGWSCGSVLGGQSINRLGYRWIAVAGMALIVIGYGFFLSPLSRFGVTVVIVSAVSIGVGMGLSNLTTLVAAQSAVPVHRIGVGTSTLMLCRTFGGAFAVSLMGTVLFSKMQRGLEQLITNQGVAFSAALREKIADPQNLLEPATRALIPPEHLPKLAGLLGEAIWLAFSTTFVLMVAGLVLSLFMAPDSPDASASARHSLKGRDAAG